MIDVEKMPYRKNVGIVLINKENKIFVGHRMSVEPDDKYGWQMPQGGIEDGENPLNSAYRELLEETGVAENKTEFLSECKDEITYDFPMDLIIKKQGTYMGQFRGQSQTWFALKFIGNYDDINLHATSEEQEFRQFSWEDENFIMEHCISWRVETYKQVFNWLHSEKII